MCHVTFRGCWQTFTLPEIFVSWCHFLQQAGDVVRNTRHGGNLTADTVAMELIICGKAVKVEQKIYPDNMARMVGWRESKRSVEPDT